MSYFDILPIEITVRIVDNESLYGIIQIYTDLRGSLMKEYIRINDVELYMILSIITKDLGISWEFITSYLFHDSKVLKNNVTLRDITKDYLYRYYLYLIDPWDTEDMGNILPVLYTYRRFKDIYDFVVLNRHPISIFEGMILAKHTDMKWEGEIITFW